MALRSDGFVDIDIHTLESVLSRETLNCKEIHVWDAALRWASAECIRQDLEPTPANQRQLLGEILIIQSIHRLASRDYDILIPFSFSFLRIRLVFN